MKIVLSLDRLLDSLNIMSSVITGKVTSSEIYSCILIETESEKIKLTASDGDITIISYLDAEIQEEGKLAISAKRLIETLRELENNELIIQNEDEHNALIICGRGNYKIMGFDPELYPSHPEINEEFDVEIPVHIINRMVDKVAFAVANEDPRPALNGIYWSISDRGFEMAATDTHKLACITYMGTISKSVTTEDDKVEAIIPPKTLKILNKFQKEEELSVNIKFLENHILFQAAEFYILSTLIRGPYPEYQRAIPTTNDKIATIPTKEFLKTVRRASLFSSSITHMVKFVFNSDILLLNSKVLDTGEEANEELPITYNGEQLEIGFNAEYIHTILKLIDSEKVLLKLNGPNAACVIVPEEQRENEDLIFVVMPLRFS